MNAGRDTVMTFRDVLAVALAVFVLSAAPVALACESAGPNAHIGTVTAVDVQKNTLSLKDAESGMKLTFVASPDLLKTVKVNDQVKVTFTEDGKTLRATAITRG
jgi:hypothetical protein